MRTVAYVLVALVAMSLAIPEVLVSYGASGTLGLRFDPKTAVVTSVDPNGPLAGRVQAGDLIDFAALRPGDRVHLRRGIVRREAVTVPVRRAGAAMSVLVTAVPAPVEPIDAWSERATAAVTIITCILGVMAVFRRRDVLGLALFCICVGSGTGNVWLRVAPPNWSIVAIFPIFLVATAQVVGFTLFCTRFPSGQADASIRYVERLSLLVTGIGTTAYVVYASGYALPVNGTRDWYKVEAIAFVVVYITAYILFRRRIPTFDGEARLRARWIEVGLTYQVVLAVTFTSLQLLTQSGLQIPPGVSTWLNLLAPAPYVMYYALFGTRVVDPRVIGARALVYSIVLFFTAVAIALVDWRLGSVIEHWSDRLDPAVKGLAAAVVVVVTAFALGAVHRRVDVLADVIFFAERRRRESRIVELALQITTAERGTIENALTIDAATMMHLASAALFGRREQPLERIQHHGWNGFDDHLEFAEPFVDAARTRRAPVRIRDFTLRSEVRFPNGDATPIEAIPAVAGGTMTALAVYGYNQNGEPLAPSQHAVLVQLVDAAARAYERIELEAERAANDALRDEINRLREQQRDLHEPDGGREPRPGEQRPPDTAGPPDGPPPGGAEKP